MVILIIMQLLHQLFFSSYHNESIAAALVYDTGADQAQGTSFQALNSGIGNDNDQCTSGTFLYNPSSTVFVKHFIATTNLYDGTYSQEIFVAGYCNVTAAIDGVQFKTKLWQHR
jgi:hypothetical protein